MRFARAALAALTASLALVGGLAPAARAAGDMQTGIADDRLLLRGDGSADHVAATWAAMGIDTVRVHVRWVEVTPEPNARRMPAGFQGANPKDPMYNWARLDQGLTALHAHGIDPILTVTGSGPLWASQKPSLGNARYRPSPRLFGQFASAVAQRYGALAKQYIVWNEPNLPAWLQPQFRCSRRSCTPESPTIYRELFRHAAGAIRREDPDAEVLFGALARAAGRRPGRTRRSARSPSCARWPASRAATTALAGEPAGPPGRCRPTGSPTTPTPSCSRPSARRSRVTTPPSPICPSSRTCSTARRAPGSSSRSTGAGSTCTSPSSATRRTRRTSAPASR